MEKRVYITPKVKTVEIKSQATICITSYDKNGINDMTVDSDAGDQFN